MKGKITTVWPGDMFAVLAENASVQSFLKKLIPKT